MEITVRRLLVKTWLWLFVPSILFMAWYTVARTVFHNAAGVLFSFGHVFAPLVFIPVAAIFIAHLWVALAVIAMVIAGTHRIVGRTIALALVIAMFHMPESIWGIFE
jgi:hypothetical protein